VAPATPSFGRRDHIQAIAADHGRRRSVGSNAKQDFGRYVPKDKHMHSPTRQMLRIN
jgi:hypothetical protein